MFSDYCALLNRMYDNEYYTDKDGYCRFFSECKKNINEPVKFYSDRVKIGEKYGECYEGKKTPKMLFCGLEGVHKGINETKIPSIDNENGLSKPSLTATNMHYRGLRYVLSYIMSGLFQIRQPNDATLHELDNPVFKEFLNYYCLTNIYKCAFSERTSGLPHSKEMKHNCYELFFSEIDVLKPDIVVLQVVSGCPPKMWEAMKRRCERVEIISRAERNDNTSVYRMYNKDTKKAFLCLWTYHGNGAPYCRKENSENNARFANNLKYIKEDLNPVLDKTVEELKKIISEN